MAKQVRQTAKRLRAAEEREKAQATPAFPRRIDVDRGLIRGLIGLAIAAACFLILNLDTARQDPKELIARRYLRGRSKARTSIRKNPFPASFPT